VEERERSTLKHWAQVIEWAATKEFFGRRREMFAALGAELPANEAWDADALKAALGVIQVSTSRRSGRL
jgi:hypothetical protein